MCSEEPAKDEKGTFPECNKQDELEQSSITNFEDVLVAIGGFGRFQCFILILLFALEIPAAFVMLIPVFVGKDPGDWRCDNETIPEDVDKCLCNGTLTADSDTIVTEWRLVCSSSWVSDFITSIQMFGMLFGNLQASQFADWYGRKYAFLGTVLCLMSGSIMSALAPNPYVYALARLICGTGISVCYKILNGRLSGIPTVLGYINVICMGSLEFMPPAWRSVASSIGPTGEGIMLLGLIAYFVRPWRLLYWATAAPFLLIFIIYPLLPESPRWLLRHQRYSEASDVLSYMAKMNGRPAVDRKILEKIGEREQLDASNPGSTKRVGYSDFFRNPSLRTNTLYLSAIWGAWSVTFYGIGYNIKNVKGDPYINVALLGLANAIGQRVALPLNNYLGRRKSLFFSMTFCALCLVALAILLLTLDMSLFPHYISGFCLMGTLAMAWTRSAARLLTGESFPTSVRTMALGLVGVVANIAGFLCPQLAFVGAQWPAIPFFTFAIVSVGGSLISFRMKETADQPLQDEIVQQNHENAKNSNV